MAEKMAEKMVELDSTTVGMMADTTAVMKVESMAAMMV
jgi:hypothetical protein